MTKMSLKKCEITLATLIHLHPLSMFTATLTAMCTAATRSICVLAHVRSPYFTFSFPFGVCSKHTHCETDQF